MLTYRQPFAKEWPVTQGYGDKITSAFHTGIDYGCPLNTPILASADGTVVFAAWDNTGYGNLVMLRHTENCFTLYAHLGSIHVKRGEKVHQGDLLGHSGTTGNSTGPHLHFEARRAWGSASHFDPAQLPLMTVDDSLSSYQNLQNEPVDLKVPSSADVFIGCPSGAFAHNSDFTDKHGLERGTLLTFTGKTCEKNGLIFCECEPRSERFWIAAHDNETRILSEDEK